MGDILSNAKLYISYSGGNRQLERVKTCDITDESGADVVTAMGVKGGAGFRFKEGGHDLALEVFLESGTPEVDYFALKLTRERFSITLRPDGGGQEYKFTPAIVAEFSRKDDDQGSHMASVKLKALRVIPLPAALTS